MLEKDLFVPNQGLLLFKVCITTSFSPPITFTVRRRILDRPVKISITDERDCVSQGAYTEDSFAAEVLELEKQENNKDV